jgi:hypothetical protein
MKAGIVELEETAVTTERLSKHVSEATNTHPKIVSGKHTDNKVI